MMKCIHCLWSDCVRLGMLADESMGGADELRSASSMSRIQNGAKLRKVDMMEVDSAMHSHGSPGRVPGTIGAVHGNSMAVEHSSPSKSHLVLPPVQVSSNSMTSNASGTQGSPVAAGSPPANIAAMLSPSAGSGTSGMSGRVLEQIDK